MQGGATLSVFLSLISVKAKIKMSSATSVCVVL